MCVASSCAEIPLESRGDSHVLVKLSLAQTQTWLTGPGCRDSEVRARLIHLDHDAKGLWPELGDTGQGSGNTWNRCLKCLGVNDVAADSAHIPGLSTGSGSHEHRVRRSWKRGLSPCEEAGRGWKGSGLEKAS